MILSQRKTLAILRGFSIPVPPYCYVTKKDDIHAVVSGLESSKEYVLSSQGEVITVGHPEVEKGIGTLLDSSEEVMIREQEDVIFECSMDLYISNECSMFFKLLAKSQESVEEIFNKKLWNFQVERAMRAVGLPKECDSLFQKMAHAAFAAFCSYGAVRLMIDPIAFTKSKRLLAIRAQMLLDDSSARIHKDPSLDEPSRDYPVLVKEAVGDVVCIGNGRLLVLALADALAAHGVRSSMIIDAGEEMSEGSLEKAFDLVARVTPKQKILLYFFTGLTNASTVAKIVQGQLGKVGRVGLFLEGTNVSGAGYVLHKEREQCALLSSLSHAITWAKGR